VEEVDVLLAQLGIEFLQVSGAVRPRLVPKGVTGTGTLESLTRHVLEDQEQRRKPLLAIDQFPFITVSFHDHWLQVIRPVAAFPDVLQEPAYLNLAPSIAALVGRNIEAARDVAHEPGLQVSVARGCRHGCSY
jgi:hypothetical protein